jgi:exonuclease SbcD
LQLHFGECDDIKSVVLVEADPQRPTRITPADSWPGAC